MSISCDSGLNEIVVGLSKLVSKENNLSSIEIRILKADEQQDNDGNSSYLSDTKTPSKKFLSGNQ